MVSNRLRNAPPAGQSEASGAGPERAATTCSTREAAASLGISEQAVRQAIARGALPAMRRGRAYRIRHEELARFAQRRPSAGPGAQPGILIALPRPAAEPTLPVPATRFIGRAEELATLQSLLPDERERIVTVTGPGGIGKTRLALAGAAMAREHFPDGVHFVDLSHVSQAPLAIPVICEAIGLREPSGWDRRAQLAAFLRGKRALLVLDNVEQILEAAADIAWLAGRAPELALLVTSRAPLRIGGERVLPLPPLSLAGTAATPAEVLASDAGQLFVERAREHDPEFALDVESAPVIADICSRLDGLPLAIELAAARSRVLPPRHLRDRLQRRLPLLTHGVRDAPPRHLTMRDAIAWSYDLLAPHEQRGFRQLAVFAGGFTLEAAEAVGGSFAGAPPFPPSPPSILDLVASLVDQSLLTTERGPRGEPRFRMLETIREFGLERIGDGEATAARAAHARHYLRFAQSLRPLSHMQATRVPHDRLAADDANLRAALDWLEGQERHAEAAAMVAACWVYWYVIGRLHEAELWLGRVSGRLDEAAKSDRTRLAVARAELLMIKGEAARADVAFAAALPAVRAGGDAVELAMALIAWGASLNYGGEYAEAERRLHEAFDVAQSIADPMLRAAAAGGAQSNLANSARGQGNPTLAVARSEHALRCYRGRGFDLAESRALVDLADAAKDLGDHRMAVGHYQTSLAMAGEQGEMRHCADAMIGIACSAAAWGEFRTALLLFGAADAARARLGIGMMLPIDAMLVDRDRAALREWVDDRQGEAIMAEGRTLTLTQALALAMAVAAAPPGSGPANARAGPGARLTRREREILGLLAGGRTDREIAEALFLSPRTVSWHMRSILAKIGAQSRTEAVRQASVAGLLNDRSAAATSQ